MKNLTLLTVFSALALIGCVKTETKTTKIDIPEIKKIEVPTFKKKGLKCEIVGEAENKEIFIEIETKDDKTTASFHDFISASKISIGSASFEGYSLMNFTLKKVSEDSSTLVGESILTHKDMASLTDEGKVLTITGKLTLGEDKTGSLEQKLFKFLDDNTSKITDYQEIGKIENCEDFEAIWM